MSSADHRRAASDRILPVRARGDLRIVEMRFGGDAAYVISDPVSRQTFQFSSEEHALLTALRQPVSLRTLQRELEAAFAPRRASIVQVQRFVNRLYEQGLLVGEIPGRGQELFERGQRESRRERWANLFQVLSIRVGGFDAGPIVERIYRSLNWAFSRTGLLAVVAAAMLALFVAVGRASAMAGDLPRLAEWTRPGWWPIWLGAVVLVKVCHEFGHALACRRFGARPGEMGVLLLAGMPSLYCDVSDAWRLPSKWQRIAVSAGGMFVELFIASVALLVWSQTEPGVLHALSLSLVVVCSVGTLAINANPLLRYDGYYILADLLEVPNLAERSRGLIGAAWRRWLLDDEAAVDPWIAPSKRRALWIYAILAKTYLALVLSGLFILMLRVARPQHLQNLVYLAAAIAMAGILARPMVAAYRMATNPAVRARLRWDRVATSMLVLVGTAVAAALAPINRRIEGPLVIVPAVAHPLFAEAAGELQFALPAGASVAAGDVVVQLRNPELELALLEAAGAVREQRSRLAQLQSLQAALPSVARQLPTAQAELQAVETLLAEHQALVDALTLRAPVAGQVVATPDRFIERRRSDQLRAWSGSPLDEKNRGAWIEPRTPLCVVVEGGESVAWAGIEQTNVAAVLPEQGVRLHLEERPLATLTGRVTQVARRARENHEQGDSRTPPPGSPLGDGRYHVVRIAVDADQQAILPGTRGVAQIVAEETNLGSLVLDSLRRTFRRVF